MAKAKVLSFSHTLGVKNSTKMNLEEGLRRAHRQFCRNSERKRSSFHGALVS